MSCEKKPTFTTEGDYVHVPLEEWEARNNIIHDLKMKLVHAESRIENLTEPACSRVRAYSGTTWECKAKKRKCKRNDQTSACDLFVKRGAAVPAPEEWVPIFHVMKRGD
jgi:hypothetical protein